ncbi:hypothetical protein ACEWY4_024139 [Coilia grayii]|uniref:Protein kinase domain-containing protein n=1 Tax=Coilia grayii TaxID=363190 RepID=A0ABD1J2L0_9TELE
MSSLQLCPSLAVSCTLFLLRSLSFALSLSLSVSISPFLSLYLYFSSTLFLSPPPSFFLFVFFLSLSLSLFALYLTCTPSHSLSLAFLLSLSYSVFLSHFLPLSLSVSHFLSFCLSYFLLLSPLLSSPLLSSPLLSSPLISSPLLSSPPQGWTESLPLSEHYAVEWRESSSTGARGSERTQGGEEGTMAVFKPENVEDLYEVGVVLGSGHFGQVREVRERCSGARWAGKFLKIRRGAGCRLGMERKCVEREVEVLQTLQHQNIMALKDVFESRAEIVLIVELISGGELFDFIAEKESLSESEAIQFLKQILQGVSYMHSKHIGHFDLKPENIMLSSNTLPNPDVKIIDFGMAHRFIQGEEYRSMGGTPQYIAPEIINYEPLSTAADMWSMGVITYILLSGLSPFQGYTDEETLLNITGIIYVFDDQHFSMTSAMAKDFIQKLLVKDQG